MTVWKRRAAGAIAAGGTMLILWGAIGHLAASAAERAGGDPGAGAGQPQSNGLDADGGAGRWLLLGSAGGFQHLGGVKRVLSGYAGGDARRLTTKS